MAKKNSETKKITKLTLAATAALLAANGKPSQTKTIQQEIIENLVPKNQIQRVQEAPKYEADYTIKKGDYKNK